MTALAKVHIVLAHVNGLSEMGNARPGETVGARLNHVLVITSVN